MWSYRPSSLYNSLLRGGYTYPTETNLYSELKKTREAYRDEPVAEPKLAPVKDPSYIELVRIALCYYIARRMVFPRMSRRSSMRCAVTFCPIRIQIRTIRQSSA